MLAMAQKNEQDDELDRGATYVAPGTERTCALTRTLKPVDEMIRFVVGPAGDAVPDLKRKLPGRGIWITATRSALEQAVKGNVFARGFRRNVCAAPDLAEATERLLEQGALDALAIAGKAGQVIGGFAKVEAAVDRDDLKALIHAADAAEDGKRKLDAAFARKNPEKSREIAIIVGLTGAQLDLALNRPNVVHAALFAGPVSETFLARAKRLERFRTGQSPDLVSALAPTDGVRGQNT
ncbi:MAG TPA: RNA-binding protein [Pseudolabrys sp.]|nr:RNA-binding protein [Pseudolabrys sp.]